MKRRKPDASAEVTAPARSAEPAASVDIATGQKDLVPSAAGGQESLADPLETAGGSAASITAGTSASAAHSAEAGAPALCTGLQPVVDARSRLLILGSMPGEASLRAQQYYGHPRNHFWPLLYSLLDGGEPAAAYADRLAFALSRGVALWDVLGTCEREGSLDSAIRRPEANDFRAFFAEHGHIQRVFFNGQAAAELYRRLTVPQLAGGGPPSAVLPSSSPARAMALPAKLAGWQPVREVWLELGGQGR